MNFNQIIRTLEGQRTQIDNAITALREVYGSDGHSRHAGTDGHRPIEGPGEQVKTKRRISAASRRKMAESQKRRWAKVRRQAARTEK